MNLRKTISRTVVAAMIAQHGLPALAQDDFGGEFPPPPVGDSNFDSSNAGAAHGNTTAGTGSGTLTKNQKDRFAKASIEDITDANFPEMIDSFDYPNVELQEIVKAISELTGKNFIIDNGLRGKISIIAPSKITVAEAYKAFLSALAINGYAIVPSGKFLKIRSARNAQRDSIETYSGNYYPNSDQMITRIIHLKHISAEAVNRDLRILSSKDGEMSIYPPTNSLILSDYGSNIDRVMKIISQLDVPGFEDQLEVIPVRYAKAKDLADLIDKIVNKGQGGTNNRSGGFTAGVPRFTRPTGGSQGSQGSAYYMVIPDDRTNSLIVVGNKAGISRIKKLLSQLDFRIQNDQNGGVYVYYVKHGDAKKIAATLQGVAKDSAPKSNGGGAGGLAPGLQLTSQGVQQSADLFGADVKIQADEGTNSLVIVASKPDYDTVLNLLNKIDIPRDQVYVETVVMEMRSTDALDYQIGYFKFDESGGKIGFNGLSDGSLNTLLTPQGGNGSILGFGSGDKVTLTPPGGGPATTISSLLGFITFLKKNANANVLSTPQILALDSQEAEIEVGDKVVTSSTTTPSVNGSAPITTPTMEDATIKLKIKPFISPTSNSVRLEIDNSVKQISLASTPPKFKDETQPLATRHVKTNIAVNNGDTAVLGGLMKEDDIEQVTKVPLLGDIPILGWLFKSRSTQKSKTNMLIFLTPKIIRTREDGTVLLGQKLEERQNYIKSIGGRDPYGETMDKLQKKRKE